MKTKDKTLRRAKGLEKSRLKRKVRRTAIMRNERAKVIRIKQVIKEINSREADPEKKTLMDKIIFRK